MCGIVACIIYPREGETNQDDREHLARILFTSILEQTETRGRDATGVVIHTADGDWVGLKGSIPSKDFIDLKADEYRVKELSAYTCREDNEPKGAPVPERSTYMGFLENYWTNNPQKVRVILGHCRKATKGDPDILHNDHPLVVGPIVGIHNGGIKNYDEILAKHKDDFEDPTGEVDSEIIFHLVKHFYPDEGIMTPDQMYEVTRRLEMFPATRGGTVAVYFHEDVPGVVYAFRKGDRPLVFAYSKKLGLLFLISEDKFLKGGESLLKTMGRFDSSITDPEFTWKTSPDHEAYVIDSRKELATYAGIESLHERRDIKGTLTEYEVKTTTTATNWQGNHQNRWQGQGTHSAYDEGPDDLGKEALKKVPTGAERYLAPPWEKITFIPPVRQAAAETPVEVVEAEVVDDDDTTTMVGPHQQDPLMPSSAEVAAALSQAVPSSITTRTPPTTPTTRTSTASHDVFSADSEDGGVNKYLKPADWAKFVEHLTTLAEQCSESELLILKQGAVALVKQSYGKGRGFHANDVKLLADTLKYIFLYRLKDLASLRNLLDLAGTAVPGFAKPRIIELMGFKDQNELENAYLLNNTARAAHHARA